MRKGDIILYRSIINEPEGKLYLARTDSWRELHTDWIDVIMLEGKSGYVSCKHCTVLDPVRLKELLDAILDYT